ncbi:MAG: VOC family protein [Chloroflexota bacterium]
MNTAIQGIHHITFICANAQRTKDFYTQILGQRFVKRTINFDDPSAYHLYFGDRTARPETLVTFFEWPHAGPSLIGVGTTHHLAFLTESTETQLKWKRWLTESGVRVTGPFDRVYFTSIYFQDPDGVILEIATRGPGWTLDESADALGAEMKPPPPEVLIGNRDEDAIRARVWPEPIDAITPDMTLSQLHHITAIGSDIERTTAFYTDLLGMRLVKRTLNMDNPQSPHYYYAAPDGHPGSIITYFAYKVGDQRTPTTMPRGRLGVGITHHFALAVANDDAQAEWRDRLLSKGVQVTPILDRCYFKSIYFRDPDGHIVEIATNGPGFCVDEDEAHLGESLQLPPWMEHLRGQIEAGLVLIQ